MYCQLILILLTIARLGFSVPVDTTTQPDIDTTTQPLDRISRQEDGGGGGGGAGGGAYINQVTRILSGVFNGDIRRILGGSAGFISNENVREGVSNILEQQIGRELHRLLRNVGNNLGDRLQEYNRNREAAAQTTLAPDQLLLLQQQLQLQQQQMQQLLLQQQQQQQIPIYSNIPNYNNYNPTSDINQNINPVYQNPAPEYAPIQPNPNGNIQSVPPLEKSRPVQSIPPTQNVSPVEQAPPIQYVPPVQNEPIVQNAPQPQNNAPQIFAPQPQNNAPQIFAPQPQNNAPLPQIFAPQPQNNAPLTNNQEASTTAGLSIPNPLKLIRDRFGSESFSIPLLTIQERIQNLFSNAAQESNNANNASLGATAMPPNVNVYLTIQVDDLEKALSTSQIGTKNSTANLYLAPESPTPDKIHEAVETGTIESIDPNGVHSDIGIATNTQNKIRYKVRGKSTSTHKPYVANEDDEGESSLFNRISQLL